MCYTLDGGRGNHLIAVWRHLSDTQGWIVFIEVNISFNEEVECPWQCLKSGREREKTEKKKRSTCLPRSNKRNIYIYTHTHLQIQKEVHSVSVCICQNHSLINLTQHYSSCSSFYLLNAAFVCMYVCTHYRGNCLLCTCGNTGSETHMRALIHFRLQRKWARAHALTLQSDKWALNDALSAVCGQRGVFRFFIFVTFYCIFFFLAMC